jgi:hypothetical protein
MNSHFEVCLPKVKHRLEDTISKLGRCLSRDETSSYSKLSRRNRYSITVTLEKSWTMESTSKILHYEKIVGVQLVISNGVYNCISRTLARGGP